MIYKMNSNMMGLRQRKSFTVKHASSVEHENDSLPETEIEIVENEDDSNSVSSKSTPEESVDIVKTEAKVVSASESKRRKIIDRVVYGALMIFLLVVILYGGHVYVCGLVVFFEGRLFHELVKVRYSQHFDIIKNRTLPFFRTTQWCWFITAIFYTYSEFVCDVLKSNKGLHHLTWFVKWQVYISFLLYSAVFVLTIATLNRDHIRFQMNNLCWTIVVLFLTVGQLKYIMHNVYNGLIWFALPSLLVIANDIFAYVFGMICGKKFIRKPLINMSPNKTWEGFIGAFFCTMIFGWYMSRIFSQYTWMTCPVHEFDFLPKSLSCEPDPIFVEARSYFPSQMFEIIPRHFMRLVPGIVEICSVDRNPKDLTACVSGLHSHSHHHFELLVDNVIPIQIHFLALSLFASLVAPFGGFLASAIKRAYGVKDFASFIPGHGGIMDRLDCQLLMALCTWVHYNAFVKIHTVSVPNMLYMYKLLSESEKIEFFDEIKQLMKVTGKA